MAQRRFHRSWSDDELRAALALAATLEPEVQIPAAQMRPGTGWNEVQSDAIIGVERPGPPLPGGAFERSRALVEHFAFSDPRIVCGHYDSARPLEGRDLLLELRTLGLHFLSSVRIGVVREYRGERETRFGYRVDTLPGHIETGREWYLLVKDHRSGEVRFRIRASWRGGDLPHWWLRWGFAVLGRRYQRAWHHLAHLRLRRLLETSARAAAVEAEGLVHEGPEIPEWKLLAYGGRALGVRLTRVEQERELMRRDRMLVVVGLGVMAGMRSMSAPAFLAHYYARKRPQRRGPIVQWLQSTATRRSFTAFSLGELVADKLPWLPPRIHPPALIGRVASGAFVGAALADSSPSPRWKLALLGGAAALASSFGFYALRQRAVRRWHVPKLAAALAEDVSLGTLGMRLLTSLDRPAFGARRPGSSGGRKGLRPPDARREGPQ